MQGHVKGKNPGFAAFMLRSVRSMYVAPLQVKLKPSCICLYSPHKPGSKTALGVQPPVVVPVVDVPPVVVPLVVVPPIVVEPVVVPVVPPVVALPAVVPAGGVSETSAVQPGFSSFESRMGRQASS